MTQPVGKKFCTLLLWGHVFRGMLFWVPWHSAIFINSLLLSPKTFEMFFHVSGRGWGEEEGGIKINPYLEHNVLTPGEPNVATAFIGKRILSLWKSFLIVYLINMFFYDTVGCSFLEMSPVALAPPFSLLFFFSPSQVLFAHALCGLPLIHWASPRASSLHFSVSPWPTPQKSQNSSCCSPGPGSLFLQTNWWILSLLKSQVGH